MSSRTISTTASAAAAALYLAAAMSPAAVEAGWIDPDTPRSAYETHSLPARPPRVPNSKNPRGEASALCTVGSEKVKCLSNGTAADGGGDDANVTAANGTSALLTQAPTTESPTSSPTAAYVPRRFELVMSDEFDTPGRTFEDGSDPRWTALEKNDYTNDAQHYYSASNAYTDDEGQLIIETEAKDTDFVGYDDVNKEKVHSTKHFKSAMIQSWNKFCFTGGIIEAEVVLPGKPDAGGLWPAFWLLGNLARHTYVASSQHVWPWAVTSCTNKSRDSQLISGCDSTAHWDIEPGLGRGSPEIDIFEIQAGNIKANTGKFIETPVGQPFMSASYQLAPGLPYNRPGPGYWPGPGQWYDGLVGGNQSALNILFYGAYNHFLDDTNPARQDYWSDAISYNRQLYEDHFVNKHKYRVEWDVPDREKGTDGYLHWFLDDELVLKINGSSIIAKEQGTEISSEPSYILMNTAVSSQWGFPAECPANCPCKKFDCHARDWHLKCGFSSGFCDMLRTSPAKYKVNYVRVYQDPTDPKQKVGCSTPERPTRKWIDSHQDMYKEEGDKVPLKKVRRGGGRCTTDEDCGGGSSRASSNSSHSNSTVMKGACDAPKGRRCVCFANFTGPRCLSHMGRDDVIWDEPDTLSDVGFHPPSYFPPALVGGLVGCFVVLFVGMLVKRRSRRKGTVGGYMAVPNVPKRHNGQFA